MSTHAKKPTNLSLDQALINEARELGVNLSQAAEGGLREAVSKAKSEQWNRDNKEAIEYYNDYIKENGLPLEKYRPF